MPDIRTTCCRKAETVAVDILLAYQYYQVIKKALCGNVRAKRILAYEKI
jgi:hypothetical protein